MSESECTVKDKYVDSSRDSKGPGDCAAESVKAGTNAVMRGWQRVVKYFNQGK